VLGANCEVPCVFEGNASVEILVLSLGLQIGPTGSQGSVHAFIGPHYG